MKKLGLILVIGLISLPAYGLLFNVPDLGGNTSTASTGDTFDLNLPGVDNSQPLFETAADGGVFQGSLKDVAREAAKKAKATTKIWEAAGVGAPEVDELTDGIYAVLKESITNYGALYDYFANQQTEFADFVKQGIKNFLGEDAAKKAEDAIEAFGKDVVADIATYRVATIEGINDERINAITEIVAGRASASTDEEWDKVLEEKLIPKINEEIMGKVSLNDDDIKAISAKVISALTGLSFDKVIEDPDSPDVQKAIAKVAEDQGEEYGNLLNAGL
jgi:hypothetical protein